MRSGDDGGIEGRPRIDELLDRAVAAINRGDRATATALAGQVLAADEGNFEAEDLLAATDDGGEIRRLTIFFADLVDSTVLSTQVEPETYRLVVGRYRDQVVRIVASYEGHIASTKGDGLLAVFGHPIAHEDDVRRAVQAGLDITRVVGRLSQQAKRRFGIEISVRVGVHRGLVYLDTAGDEVYGLAANLAARVSGLALPDSVAVSQPVESLIRNNFEVEPRPAAHVKGVKEPVVHFLVVTERTQVLRADHSPLVGREAEVLQIESSWAKTQLGTLVTPGLVFRGEPGIGKSRLSGVATELVHRDGGPVLELAGSPLHPDAGLHPIRTLLERRCGIGRASDHTERIRLLENEVRGLGLNVLTIVPLLAAVLGIGADAGYEPVAAEGRRLYEMVSEAVQNYVHACFGDRAGLLVVEDVHWFDPSTVEVLGALLNSARGDLLVVVTGRPGVWLPTDWPARVFELAPLTDEQTDELIGSLHPGLSAIERAEVVERCDGVPFYVEEVVAGLSQTGVPETLYEPLFARLRTSPHVVPVIEAASVIGRELDRDLLCSVVDVSDEAVDKAIGDLEDARVLEPWGQDTWRFRHELLREVAAELAPPTVRRKLNARVADALTSAGDPEWRVVAIHYERAGRFDDAAAAYRRAATEARRRGALSEARTCLGQALEQLEHCPPGADRDRGEMATRLERGLVVSAAEGYQSQAAAEDFERCLQLAGTDLRDDELVATLLAVIAYYAVRGDLRRADQIRDSLMSGLAPGHPVLPVIEALSGTLAFRRGEFDRARACLEGAVAGLAGADLHRIDEVWRTLSDPVVYANMHLGLTQVVRGDFAGATNLLTVAAQRAEQLPFPRGPWSLAFVRSLQSWLHIEAGQFDKAVVSATDLCELAEQHGFEHWRLEGQTYKAATDCLAALSADDHDLTLVSVHIATLTGLLDALRQLEVYRFGSFHDAILCRVLIATGQPQTARAHLDAGLQRARDTGIHFYDAELLRLRAQTRTDPEARQLDVEAALQLARQQGATLFELRAALDDYHLRGGPALAALRDVAGRFPAESELPEVTRARAGFG
jgi:class 3 adenylate cyclase/tetratricopeptide (TPR) repeat protein